MNVIQDRQVTDVLSKLHSEASSEMLQIMKGLSKGVFRKLQPTDMKDAYIAIDASQGKFIYDLLVSRGDKHIIEFGTSFGISSIYLGAAARENGGRVITTEILDNKCEVALRNFDEAGLSEFIELRKGDALVTLKDVEPGIDFLLLDGWNDLYLPLLQFLEPKFKKGTLIYTDNASMVSAKPFLRYVRNSPKYASEFLKQKGGSELTEYLG